MGKHWNSIAGITLLAAALCTQSANAADVNTGDYTALPPGTNLAMWYQLHSEADSYHPDGSPTISNDTSLKADISILRLIHFADLGGMTIDPQILIPFGRIHDARVGGANLGSASGFADPIVGATFWFINDPKAGVSGRYLGLTPLVYVPVGAYDKHDALNLGENRWKGDLQLGWIEPLYGALSMELAANMVMYGHNDEAGSGNQTLKQDNSYNLQAYLRYDINPQQRVALGYSATTGGKQYLDGAYTGAKTDFQQVRLEFQQMVSPKVQLGAQLTSDVYASGGFKNNFGIKLRALLVF